MARRSSNFFSILSLQPEAEEDAEAEPRAGAVESRATMRSDKKKKSRKPKLSTNSKEEGVEKLLSKLSINGDGGGDHGNDDDVQEKLEQEKEALFPPLQPPAPPSQNSSFAKKNEGSVSLLKWPLVWIDLEMTGLDIEKDRILEIACMITDGKLREQIEGPDLIINQSEEQLGSMGDWCQTQHTASGLVEGVRKSSLTEKEAEQEVLKFVQSHAENGGKQLLLAGNSVYVDLLFLRKYMPELAALFSHVVVDVSSISALCLRWFPKEAKGAPVKKKSHRALEDIKESIAELRYMQKTIFKSSKY